VRLENVALADHDGSQTLYYLPEAPGDRSLPPWYDTLASFRKDVILRHKTEIPDIETRLASVEVPCLTFDSLCRKLQIVRVDLIHIDAEGYDFEIIKSIDLARYRPTILLFEHFHMDGGTFAACLSHLETQGYEYVHLGMDTVCLNPATLTRSDRRMGRVWGRLREQSEEPSFR
jgi:FkbM family methyltransferase